MYVQSAPGVAQSAQEARVPSMGRGIHLRPGPPRILVIYRYVDENIISSDTLCIDFLHIFEKNDLSEKTIAVFSLGGSNKFPRYIRF